MSDSEALVQVGQTFTARTYPWTYPHRADFFGVGLQLRFSIRVLRRTKSCPISASIWPRVQGCLSLAVLNCDRGDLCSEEFCCWFELLPHTTYHHRANVPSYACSACLATEHTSRHDLHSHPKSPNCYFTIGVAIEAISDRSCTSSSCSSDVACSCDPPATENPESLRTGPASTIPARSTVEGESQD